MSLGIAAVKTDARTEQLATAPSMFEGKLLVPLSLLTDLLPRVATGLSWDAARNELRRAIVADTSVEPPAAAPPARRAIAAPESERPPRRERTQHVVVVDPGHGGPDRGMRGPIGSRRVHEADITLGVSRRLREALQKRGFGVVMTRTTDTLIALADRGHIANRAQGSVFVSVHVNAANPRWRRPQDARGFETYFLSTAKTDDERRVEAMENEAVQYRKVLTSDDSLSPFSTT
jgi:N-acetylmuramoyl-L-alanine amidase